MRTKAFFIWASISRIIQVVRKVKNRECEEERGKM